MHITTIKTESVFQALGDETRLRIVRLMASTGEESCLCELVDSLLEPSYKISRHLKILRQAGLLSSRKEGRWVYHRLVTDPTYLKKLYTAVRAFPDLNGGYDEDLKRFQQRLCLREDGCCQVGILSEVFRGEAAR